MPLALLLSWANTNIQVEFVQEKKTVIKNQTKAADCRSFYTFFYFAFLMCTREVRPWQVPSEASDDDKNRLYYFLSHHKR